MRNYQPTKNNPWQLDKNLYALMICTVRNYPVFKQKIKDHIYVPGFEMVKVGTGNSVRAVKTSDIERQAILLANINSKIDAVDKALEIVPEEYRQPILDNIIAEKPLYSYLYASVRTLSRHKSRFLYKLAYELDYI